MNLVLHSRLPEENKIVSIGAQMWLYVVAHCAFVQLKGEFSAIAAFLQAGALGKR